MRLAAVESKTAQIAFAPRTVELSEAGEKFWEVGHDAKF